MLHVALLSGPSWGIADSREEGDPLTPPAVYSSIADA
jgi:hypothetical protein